jgi:hypothetical protein
MQPETAQSQTAAGSTSTPVAALPVRRALALAVVGLGLGLTVAWISSLGYVAVTYLEGGAIAYAGDWLGALIHSV